MSRFKTIVLAMVIGAAVAIPAASASGGHGGKGADPAATCSLSGSVVTASGLPTGVVINFQYTDASGKYGWVLGSSDSGAFAVTVPAPIGSTTYQFISKTWGPDKYNVYASCSA